MTVQTVNGTDETIRELAQSLRKSDDTVDKLTEMLENSEKRYRSIEKNIRWMGVALLGLGLIMISYTSSNFITQVQAKSDVVQTVENPLEENKSAGTSCCEELMKSLNKEELMKLLPKEELMKLMKFLHNLNGLVDNMNHLTKYLSVDSIKADDAKTLTEVVEKVLSSDPKLKQELQQVKQAGGGAITYLLIEAAKGLGHIDDLEKHIVEMNRNMHNMSVNMSIMSYDINSTMGRMGRAMPWMP